MTLLLAALSLLLSPLGPLDVPHVSQWGLGADGHRYDCGAAGVVMLQAAYGLESGSVDAVYDAMAPQGDAPLSLFRTLEPYLDGIGLPATAFQFATLAKMAQLLEEGRPFVAHVWGNHFVLVVGMDAAAGLVWVQDPLRWSGLSVWRLATLERALGERRVILAPDAGLAERME